MLISAKLRQSFQTGFAPGQHDRLHRQHSCTGINGRIRHVTQSSHINPDVDDSTVSTASHVSGGVEKPSQPWLSAIMTARSSNRGVGGHRLISFVLQLIASLLSVVLYVWSTYSAATPGGFRHLLDLGLCCFFATELGLRVRSKEIEALFC